MKVGDLVVVRKLRDPSHPPLPDAPRGPVGLIIDSMEGEDGFFTFEVVFGVERGWFEDLELAAVVP